MCLIVFSWQMHPRWPLVLAANRDEFHARPSAPLEFWADAPEILAGRDLENGGTWLGISRRHRVAAVTNVRGPEAEPAGLLSRGWLPRDFLLGDLPAMEHARQLCELAANYRRFNLVLFDHGTCAYVTNHPEPRCERIPPGLVSISNGSLASDWPKMRAASVGMRIWLERGDAPLPGLFVTLSDETPAPVAALPDTGVGYEMERFLSPLAIRGETYGTRAMTVLGIDPAGLAQVEERSFGPALEPLGARKYELSLTVTQDMEPRPASGREAGSGQ